MKKTFFNPFDKKFSHKSDVKLQRYIPWHSFIDKETIMQKEGLLQSTILFQGPNKLSVTSEEKQYLSEMLNNLLKQQKEGWAFFVDTRRQKYKEYQETGQGPLAAQMIDREKNDFFDKNNFYHNFFFLTVVAAPSLILDNKVKEESPFETAERALPLFKEEVYKICLWLKYKFRIELLEGDNLISFLKSTTSSHIHYVKQPPPGMPVEDIVADVPLVTGDFLRQGRDFIGVISIIDYPSYTYPSMLEGLLHFQGEFRVSNRIIFSDKAKLKKEINGRRSTAIFNFKPRKGLPDPGAMNDNESLETALSDLQGDALSFVHYTSVVCVRGGGIPEVKEKCNEIITLMQNLGFTAVMEKKYTFSTWLSSHPGNVNANIRRELISTANAGDLFPFVSIEKGLNHSTYMDKHLGVNIAHIVGSTPEGGQFGFNLHQDGKDVGITVVIGQTGSGKSVLLQYIGAAYASFGDVRVVNLDKGETTKSLTLAMGGSYFKPGDSKAKGFQPLRMLDSPEDITWAGNLIEIMLEKQNVTVDYNIRGAIKEALDHMKSMKPEYRRISTFIQTVQHKAVKLSLEPYTEKGIYSFFDEVVEEADYHNNWISFELKTLYELGEAALLPGLFSIIKIIKRRFDLTPTYINIDEAFSAFKHQYLKQELMDGVLNWRKENIFLTFATQSAAHIVNNEIYDTLGEQLSTVIICPDEKALSEQSLANYKKLNLNEEDCYLLTCLRQKQDYFFKQGGDKSVFRLDLENVALGLICRLSPDQLSEIEKLPGEQRLEAICSAAHIKQQYEEIKGRIA